MKLKYTDRFQSALSNTKELALSVEPIKFENTLPIEEIKSIIQVCVNALYQGGYANSESLAGKCVPANMLISEVLEWRLGVKTYITIGDKYWSDSDIYCEMSYESITRELKKPDVTKPIQAHVWITLTDGTIIDFTGEAHIDILQERGNFPAEECFQVIRPSDVIEGGFHRPFLIGADFLFKTGAIRLDPAMSELIGIQD